MSRVLCIGGLTLDWVYDGSSTWGPTVGGNALYGCAGALLTGATPLLCAVVGADFPLHELSRLQDAGIDTSPTRHVTGHSFRVLLDDSATPRTIRYLAGSGRNDTLDPAPAQLERTAADVAHIAAVPTSTQAALAARLSAGGVPFILDTVCIPGEIEPTRHDLLEVARTSVCFLPSVDELDQLWPALDLRAQLRLVQRETRGWVVVTRGARGSLGWDGETFVQIPAFATRVRDSTGAGDSYCGAFAAAWARAEPMAGCMAAGAAAASIVIEDLGAWHALSLPARAEARRRRDTVMELIDKEILNAVEQ